MSNSSMILALGLTVLVATTSCRPTHGNKEETEQPAKEGQLARVGTLVIYESDLEYQLKEKHSGRDDEGARRKALEELTERARLTQAALDADLHRDPVVRAEMGRILSNRLKETLLRPQLKEATGTIPVSRLREVYEAGKARFVSKEKRRIAVLWLQPGPDPARKKMYEKKLNEARDWFFEKSDLKEQPEKGFSILAVDHSEHASSRFRGGEVGWLERDGGSTDWSRAVAEIGYSLGEVGEVSSVISRPEGIFLVRLMAVKPSMQRSFESVRTQLEKEEQKRLLLQLKAKFLGSLAEKYPLQINR